MALAGCVVIGAGGHAKVAIELLRAAGQAVSYCIGHADETASHCLDVEILAGDHHLERLRDVGFIRVFVAIGDNRMRSRLAAVAEGLGYELTNAISPRAVVSPSAQLGRGVAIMAGAVINADTRIGDLAIINTSASVDHDGRIGRAVHIGPQCALAGNVTVGDESLLGARCAVIPNITIGSSATIGAGSLVIRPIPSGAVAYGSPTQLVRHTFETEERSCSSESR